MTAGSWSAPPTPVSPTPPAGGSTAWDFAGYPADVVVDLESNDVCEVPPAEVRKRYVRLLERLRAAHPTAHIVPVHSYGWGKVEPADYSAEVVAGYGDPNVSAAFFLWLFERRHCCESDYGGMARYLIAHLERVRGWTAAKPDLMSGFGWSYADASGVERVLFVAGRHRRSSPHLQNRCKAPQRSAVCRTRAVL